MKIKEIEKILCLLLAIQATELVCLKLNVTLNKKFSKNKGYIEYTKEAQKSYDIYLESFNSYVEELKESFTKLKK